MRISSYKFEVLITHIRYTIVGKTCIIHTFQLKMCFFCLNFVIGVLNSIPENSCKLAFKKYLLYDSSFVVRTRPMPEMKNIIPSIPKMASALISRVPPEVFTNITAEYIRPPMPRSVSKAPKILLRFIISVLNMNIGQVAEQPEYL